MFFIPKADAPKMSLYMAMRFLSLVTICITGSGNPSLIKMAPAAIEDILTIAV